MVIGKSVATTNIEAPQVQFVNQEEAERGGQLDPQSLVVQSGGVLIGSRLLIAGKLLFATLLFGCYMAAGDGAADHLAVD